MKIILKAFFVLITLVSCNKEPNKVKVFQPDSNTGKDVVISEGYPKNNYSKLDKLHMLALTINKTKDNDSRFLLRFGFSTIPQDAKIDSAFIYLYAKDPGHFGKDNSFSVHKINSLWINKDVNWSNQPNFDKKPMAILNAPSEKLKDYKIDVKPYIEDVISNKVFNSGFIFKLINEEGDHKGIRFHSSNSEEANKRPKLLVYYR